LGFDLDADLRVRCSIPDHHIGPVRAPGRRVNGV
jgi:hypothetical protein